MESNRKKALPIGISDFKNIIENDYYFVDKSLLIKELFETKAAATLLLRPRRFGKTLNMSMLRYFFEKTESPNVHLFKDLAIAGHSEIMKHQGRYPVIFLTFKDVKNMAWDLCYSKLKYLISDEFRRHKYLLQSNVLDDEQKIRFKAIIAGIGTQDSYETSLKDLSIYLNAYYRQPAIILIDEYDTPVHMAFTWNYYNECIGFMRNFLGAACKDNKHLAMGIITGILRVSKESIFSGLNNIDICSMDNVHYNDKFGLLETEVKDMLAYYDYSNLFDSIKTWYNGYSSGPHKVYNPWALINCMHNHGAIGSYWINSSSDNIMKKVFQEGDASIKQDLETLLRRQHIAKPVVENFVFPELDERNDMLWTLMFYGGYLTCENTRKINDEETVADFIIPNQEIYVYLKTSIQYWFKAKDSINREYQAMLDGLLRGNVIFFATVFQKLVLVALSLFDVGGDEPERFYHALVVGMLLSLQDRYEVRSNRESGYGRYDVMIIPRDTTKLGIILEFKKAGADCPETIEEAAHNALKQINEKQYDVELQDRGIKQVLKLGIAFQGKQVCIKQG